MIRILTICIIAWLGLVNLSVSVPAAEWETLVEFRDTVKRDTVPAVLVRQGKISVQPWKADEKLEMQRYVKTVFDLAPNLFRIGSSQGAIPLYRINLGSSFGGHGALWFSYMNTNVLAHELTHVVDAEHKIVRSTEFRNLVEPKIKKLRAIMLENGFDDYASGEAAKRTDLIYAAGLPSFYAAGTIQETLAELVRSMVFTQKFTPTADVQAFLQKRIFTGELVPDPSVALYRNGKAARLEGNYNDAITLLTGAIELDEGFAEAYIERGISYSRGVTHRDLSWRKRAIDDFSRALKLMSEYDWQFYLPYYERGIAFANEKQFEKAFEDLLEAKRIAPNQASRIDGTISQIKAFQGKQKK